MEVLFLDLKSFDKKHILTFHMFVIIITWKTEFYIFYQIKLNFVLPDSLFPSNIFSFLGKKLDIISSNSIPCSRDFFFKRFIFYCLWKVFLNEMFSQNCYWTTISSLFYPIETMT